MISSHCHCHCNCNLHRTRGKVRMTVFCSGDHRPLMLGPQERKTKTKKTRTCRCRCRDIVVPCVDLSENENRGKLSETIVKACEEFGFFKVVNHGVSKQAVSRLEKSSMEFFERPLREKLQLERRSPFGYGYGCKNIGFHGDKGEFEYLLMEANPSSLLSISDHPPQQHHLSRAVNDYVGAVREVACEILDLVEEGLQMQSTSVCSLSQLIRDVQSDSCFRINRYPPSVDVDDDDTSVVGFGEHSDPQILTILRSNDVPGLQICSPHDDDDDDGVCWIPVSPEDDDDHLCVFVGDAFQALTNGRFRSVRHRVLLHNSNYNSHPRNRISMMYFGAPSLNALIEPLPQLGLLTTRKYRDFTWGEFKKAVYASRLAHRRLHLFRSH